MVKTPKTLVLPLQNTGPSPQPFMLDIIKHIDGAIVLTVLSYKEQDSICFPGQKEQVIETTVRAGLSKANAENMVKFLSEA